MVAYRAIIFDNTAVPANATSSINSTVLSYSMQVYEAGVVYTTTYNLNEPYTQIVYMNITTFALNEKHGNFK